MTNESTIHLEEMPDKLVEMIGSSKMHLMIIPVLVMILKKEFKEKDPEKFYKVKFATESYIKDLKRTLEELEKEV